MTIFQLIQWSIDQLNVSTALYEGSIWRLYKAIKILKMYIFTIFHQVNFITGSHWICESHLLKRQLNCNLCKERSRMDIFKLSPRKRWLLEEEVFSFTRSGLAFHFTLMRNIFCDQICVVILNSAYSL